MIECKDSCGDDSSRYRLKISEDEVFFGTILVGNASPAFEITLENVGWEDILFQSLSITGPFTLVRTNCPDVLKPGQKGRIAVTFTPTAFGPWTGAVFIMAGRAGDHNIRLVGAGYNSNENGDDLSGIPIFLTRENLEDNTNLVYANGTYALVISDEVLANNDFYQKTGDSGEGDWGEPLGKLSTIILNGQIDLKNLDDVIHGAADLANPGHPAGTVTLRNGETYRTLANILDLQITQEEIATVQAGIATTQAAAALDASASASASVTAAAGYAATALTRANSAQDYAMLAADALALSTAYDTRAEANADLAARANGDLRMILADEANGGQRTYVRKVAGAWATIAIMAGVMRNTMAALRAQAVAGLADGTLIGIAGYYAAEDDGQGLFRWVAASTAVDDGGMVIRPDAVAAPAAGRWVRQICGGTVYPEMWGARRFTSLSDATDSLTALNAMIAWLPRYTATTANFKPMPKIVWSGLYGISDTFKIEGVPGINLVATNPYAALPSGVFWLGAADPAKDMVYLRGNRYGRIDGLRGIAPLMPTADTAMRSFINTDGTIYIAGNVHVSHQERMVLQNLYVGARDGYEVGYIKPPGYFYGRVDNGTPGVAGNILTLIADNYPTYSKTPIAVGMELFPVKQGLLPLGTTITADNGNGTYTLSKSGNLTTRNIAAIFYQFKYMVMTSGADTNNDFMEIRTSTAWHCEWAIWNNYSQHVDWVLEGIKANQCDHFAWFKTNHHQIRHCESNNTRSNIFEFGNASVYADFTIEGFLSEGSWGGFLKGGGNCNITIRHCGIAAGQDAVAFPLVIDARGSNTSVINIENSRFYSNTTIGCATTGGAAKVINVVRSTIMTIDTRTGGYAGGANRVYVTQTADGLGGGLAYAGYKPASNLLSGESDHQFDPNRFDIPQNHVQIGNRFAGGTSSLLHNVVDSGVIPAGATYTFNAAIPANCILLGITARNHNAITGATGYNIGDGVTANRWGSKVAAADNGVANAPAISTYTDTTINYIKAATNVVLTATGGTGAFAGGRVFLTVHYIRLNGGFYNPSLAA